MRLHLASAIFGLSALAFLLWLCSRLAEVQLQLLAR